MLIQTNRCKCNKSTIVDANKNVFIGKYCSTCFEVTQYERTETKETFNKRVNPDINIFNDVLNAIRP